MQNSIRVIICKNTIAKSVLSNNTEMYSTKTKYRVTPVFKVRNADGECYDLSTGVTQNIKLKQGKPKLKADKVTWYRDRQECVWVPVSATLNGKDIAIERITLTNFTKDVEATYEAGYIKLQGIDIDKINAIGKTYNLKLNVYYADRAVNEKPASLTVKLAVQ